MIGTKASSQQNAHSRKTEFRHQIMWAEWIVGDGAHHNEWFPVSQPQEDRSAMAVRDGVNGYCVCAPRNNQQSRMKVWAILRMAYQYGQGMEEWVR
jgi:hypothetical protein